MREVKIQLIGAPEGKRKENEKEAVFAEIMPETFLDAHMCKKLQRYQAG